MTKKKIQVFKEWHYHIIGEPAEKRERMSSRQKYKLRNNIK